MKGNLMLKLGLVTLIGVFAATASLANDWRFVSVDGLAANGAAELRIEDDGRFSGSTGCNRFNGSGSYAAGTLLVDQPIATTKMMCADPAVNAQEEAVLALLQDTVAVEYDAFLERLTLSTDTHSAILERASDGTGDGAPSIFGAESVVVTGIASRLNLRAQPTTSSEVVARLRPASIHTNSGCETRPDRDWCRLSVDNGVEGWAAAEFLTPLTLGSRVANGTYNTIGRLDCSNADGSDAGRCEYGASAEDDHVMLAVFADPGGPLVLHFHAGELDPISTLGPFEKGNEQVEIKGDNVRVFISGYRLDIPLSLVRL
jgi:heat shock protein HslJ